MTANLKTPDLKIPDLIDSWSTARPSPPFAAACAARGVVACVRCAGARSARGRPWRAPGSGAAPLQQPVFVIGMAAVLATGILAAIASFKVSLTDGSRRWLLVPLPALALWVSTLTDWVSIGPNGLHMGEAARCFATLLLTSVPLAIAMLAMLRYAALPRPSAVCAAGGLAVAAMTSFAVSLFHRFDATS